MNAICVLARGFSYALSHSERHWRVDGSAWRRKTGNQAVCAHLWRANACAQGVPVARTAGGPYVYGWGFSRLRESSRHQAQARNTPVTAELDIYEKFFYLHDSRSRLDIYEKFSSDDDDFSESGPHDGCNDGSDGIL